MGWEWEWLYSCEGLMKSAIIIAWVQDAVLLINLHVLFTFLIPSLLNCKMRIIIACTS